MKNHVRVNGQLLQTNKKWGALKQKQQEWIMETARKQYDQFVAVRGKLPVHGSKQQLIEQIYQTIEGRGIWIPFGEVKRRLDASIARWNRRALSLKAQDEQNDVTLNETPDETVNQEAENNP